MVTTPEPLRHDLFPGFPIMLCYYWLGEVAAHTLNPTMRFYRQYFRRLACRGLSKYSRSLEGTDKLTIHLAASPSIRRHNSS